MYGPPPDPRQVLVPSSMADEPAAYVVCIAVGIALSAAALWRRPPESLRAMTFIIGQVTILTAPLAYLIDTHVYGSFPTIDKEGSILFYLDGVHLRMVADPVASLADPAAALIGVHVGHLWVSQAFDIALSSVGAFNAQGMLYLVVGWFCAWGLLRAACGDARVAMALAMPYGMGLHVFRDLNWYTIEKAAIFCLPLYMWAMIWAARDGRRGVLAAAACFAGMCWLNLYLGLVSGIFAATAVAAIAVAVARGRAQAGTLKRVFAAAAASLVAAMPLAVWQAALMDAGPTLATPEAFLWQRAALDSFTLLPLRWNRMELWAALSLPAVAAAAAGVVTMHRDQRVQLAVVAAAVATTLAAGPAPMGGQGTLTNPFYMAAREIIPGFWRVAKPEVFFHCTWMLILAVAAIRVAAWKPGKVAAAAIYAVIVVTWLATVRTHPVYPGFAEGVESNLAPTWHRGVFQGDVSPD